MGRVIHIVTPSTAYPGGTVGLEPAGRGSLAERVLRTALLSAAGAEFALGPLEGVAELFAEARLLFRRRLVPATVEPWTSDTATVWLQ